MMFYFTHMCDVLIVLCYMYLCIVFSFCSSIILFALPTIILVYYGQHTIMRSANMLCFTVAQHTIFMDSPNNSKHEFVNNVGPNHTNSLEHLLNYKNM